VTAVNTYTEAYAEWDDRAKLFRVYLIPAAPEGNDDFDEIANTKPMESMFTGDSMEARLYRAAFCACPKDFGTFKIGEPVGWTTEAPAKRVAKAVTKEIANAKAGKPAPTDEQVSFVAQLHVVLNKKRGRR
jgi:hypothetical protein